MSMQQDYDQAQDGNVVQANQSAVAETAVYAQVLAKGARRTLSNVRLDDTERAEDGEEAPDQVRAHDICIQERRANGHVHGRGPAEDPRHHREHRIDPGRRRPTAATAATADTGVDTARGAVTSTTDLVMRHWRRIGGSGGIYSILSCLVCCTYNRIDPSLYLPVNWNGQRRLESTVNSLIPL